MPPPAPKIISFSSGLNRRFSSSPRSATAPSIINAPPCSTGSLDGALEPQSTPKEVYSAKTPFFGFVAQLSPYTRPPSRNLLPLSPTAATLPAPSEPSTQGNSGFNPSCLAVHP